MVRSLFIQLSGMTLSFLDGQELISWRGGLSLAFGIAGSPWELLQGLLINSMSYQIVMPILPALGLPTSKQSHGVILHSTIYLCSLPK